MFNDAVERELIGRNPFAKLKSAAIASESEHYVTPEETKAVLAECPDVQWKSLVGLARLAGLRCPGETHGVAWSDVDWIRGRLSVYAPKTDNTRLVPLVPELMAILEEAFAAAEEELASAAASGVKISDRPIVTLSANNRHRGLKAIVKRAGVQQWPDMYQTLRSSCETEWAAKYPQHAVSAWIGHSMEVSERHYLRVTDHLLDLASGKSAAVGRCKPSHDPAVGRSDKSDRKNAKGRKPREDDDLRPIANLS